MADHYDVQPIEAIVAKKDAATEGQPSRDAATEGQPSGDAPTEGQPSGDAPTEGQPSGDAATGELDQQQDSRSAGQESIRREKRKRKRKKYHCKVLTKTIIALSK